MTSADSLHTEREKVKKQLDELAEGGIDSLLRDDMRETYDDADVDTSASKAALLFGKKRSVAQDISSQKTSDWAAHRRPSVDREHSTSASRVETDEEVSVSRPSRVVPPPPVPSRPKR
jgi:hypothetical protein